MFRKRGGRRGGGGKLGRESGECEPRIEVIVKLKNKNKKKKPGGQVDVNQELKLL